MQYLLNSILVHHHHHIDVIETELHFLLVAPPTGVKMLCVHPYETLHLKSTLKSSGELERAQKSLREIIFSKSLKSIYHSKGVFVFVWRVSLLMFRVVWKVATVRPSVSIRLFPCHGAAWQGDTGDSVTVSQGEDMRIWASLFCLSPGWCSSLLLFTTLIIPAVSSSPGITIWQIPPMHCDLPSLLLVGTTFNVNCGDTL